MIEWLTTNGLSGDLVSIMNQWVVGVGVGVGGGWGWGVGGWVVSSECRSILVVVNIKKMFHTSLRWSRSVVTMIIWYSKHHGIQKYQLGMLKVIKTTGKYQLIVLFSHHGIKKKLAVTDLPRDVSLAVSCNPTSFSLNQTATYAKLANLHEKLCSTHWTLGNGMLLFN